MPPDPAIPGLLDLLTIRALGDADPDAPSPDRTRAVARGEAAVHRLRTVPTRNWVEVEA